MNPSDSERLREMDGFDLTFHEREHINRIALEKKLGRNWTMTTIPICYPLRQNIISLIEKGLVVASDKMVCGPLRIKEEVWGVRLTTKGAVVAKLLGLPLE